MAIAVENQDIGPCDVYWDGDYLGSTLENVVLTIKKKTSYLKADQYGDQDLDGAISGMEITVTTAIAETRDKTKWKMIFPTSTYAGTAPADYLDMNSAIATRLLPIAKELKLHPIVEGALTNRNHDVVIWKAIATEDSALTMGPSEQYKMKVVFKAFLDTTKTPPSMGRVGDTTL